MRLDKYVFEVLDKPSRTYAENLILKGRVTVNGTLVTKPSYTVKATDEVIVSDEENYASQGAFKLAKAFSDFKLDANGKICADIGCSNGGFTDVLLRHGAAHVLAVDVGECALPKRIADDERVTFLRANARELPEREYDKFDFVCCDVSFISQTLILPTIFNLLKSGGEAVTLVKPQFELKRSALSKDGIVLKQKDRDLAVKTVHTSAESLGFKVSGLTVAPVIYENKNVEYLLFLMKTN